MLDRLRERQQRDEQPRQRERTRVEVRTDHGDVTDDRDITATTEFRLGRLVYGGVLAMMGANGLRNVEDQAAYAESKGIPMPETAVVTSHALLAGGGVGIALWRLPATAATALVVFFLGVTPNMHDFWNYEGEQRQNEQINFLKNAALLGAALGLLGLAEREDD